MSQQAPATIKVLPARLANQIAAGEVVERPASVLKELLENSIDAGATLIDIDIEKGGHKKIKITDNGSGIAKDQLMLALSRHATSKVSELDDLENIYTLGFRGEALASISSVSRLTLTSRTAAQTEAWQARTEGRDMQVQVEPAAHPQGTSVEVLDLFFNTPARRKFLRTEKTEFNHIEELFNRIALSRYDVGLRLKHNGKLLKNLPAIAEGDDPLKRVKQLCGASICDGLLQVEGNYQGFRLHGWLSAPGYHRAMSDIQFVFVNNRMMRDKLIFHAIRQSFEGLLPADKFPYFVLYLEVPCNQVDVNVHPAKHEVRFHQSRLVHDFIFAVLNDSLNDAMQPKTVVVDASANTGASANETADMSSAETELKPQVQHNYQPSTDYIKPLQPAEQSGSRKGAYGSGSYSADPARSIQEAASQYTRLMTVPVADSATSSETIAPVENKTSIVTADVSANSDMRVATDSHSGGADVLLVPGQGLLLQWQAQYYLLPQSALLHDLLRVSLSTVTQPLLLPVSVKIEGAEPDSAFFDTAASAGLELQWTGKKLILKQVPAGTRKQNWQLILNQLVEQLEAKSEPDVYLALANNWTPAESHSVVERWQQMSLEHKQAMLNEHGVKVDLLDWLARQQA